MLQDFTSRSGNLLGDLQGDRLNAMTVAMDQIARPHFQAADTDHVAEIKYMGIRMRNRDVARKHLEARQPYIAKIAYGSVGHQSEASQSQKNIRVDFTDECAQSRGIIRIFNHDNSW